MVARGTKLSEANEPAQRNDAAKADAIEQTAPGLSQRKRKETSRFWLQVDRQTKRSYETLETAEIAGLAIKTRHPIVQVSVYDSVDCVNKLVELPAASS
jgi:hypothetical protein